LIKTAEQILETKGLIDELVKRLPPAQRAEACKQKYAWLANACEVFARILVCAGDRRAQIQQLKWAFRLEPTRRRFVALLRARTVRAVKSIKLRSFI
jgi:hypothetical protein